MRAAEARSVHLCALLAGMLAGCAGSLPPDFDPEEDPVVAVREPDPLAVREAPAGASAGTPASAPGGAAVAPEEPPAAAPAPSPASDAAAQGATCSGTSGTRFEVQGTLSACGTVALKVSAGVPYAWLMVAVSAPGTERAWVGGVGEMNHDTSWHWTFSAVPVPCEAGPYTVHLMVDAVDEVPDSGGREVDFCTP